MKPEGVLKCDGVEVGEGDGGVVVFVGGITAFHGEDDG